MAAEPRQACHGCPATDCATLSGSLQQAIRSASKHFCAAQLTLRYEESVEHISYWRGIAAVSLHILHDMLAVTADSNSGIKQLASGPPVCCHLSPYVLALRPGTSSLQCLQAA